LQYQPKVATTASSAAARRKELGLFLRLKRQAIAPESAGISRGVRRMTQGLRREEVAALADIGVTWYTWLEQGRPARPSADVLGRLAKVLRLSREESLYLQNLAERRAGTPTKLVMSVPPELQDMLDAFDGTALAMNARMDLIGWNHAAALVYELSRSLDWKQLNHLWRAFHHTKLQSLHRNDSDEMARAAVVLFRSLYAQHGEDPQIDDLFDALAETPAFAKAWSEKTIGRAVASVIELNTPAGIIIARTMALSPPALPGIMVILQTPVDAGNRERLHQLVAAGS
jgi:hypothetical protein